MLFGKHINRYYLRYLPSFLLGLVALILVDYMQLILPKLYRSVVNGITYGEVVVDGVAVPFDIPTCSMKSASP